MEALEAILTRRSTRKYSCKMPDRELLEKVIEAGRYAPSGSNSQTTHFIVITDNEVLKKIACVVESEFAKMEVTEDMYISLKASINAAKHGGYVFHYGAPVLIVIANAKGYSNAMADSACALENMMVAANALDLGSCWINQLKWLNEEPEILEYLYSLGMKETERVYGAVIIGYPATDSGLPNRNLMHLKGNEVTWVD